MFRREILKNSSFRFFFAPDLRTPKTNLNLEAVSFYPIQGSIRGETGITEGITLRAFTQGARGEAELQAALSLSPLSFSLMATLILSMKETGCCSE